MKRFITVILTLAMLLTMFIGCGSKKDTEKTPSENTNKTGINTPSNSGSKDVSKITPGTELSTYMSEYVETKTKIWEAMSKKFDEEQNLEFAMGTLGFAFADLAIVDISLFDSLATLEGDTFKGKLILSGFDAWKKVKGDIIEFGYDYTYTEDTNQNLKNDHLVSKGKFDKKKNSLSYERYIERNGQRNDRYVVEITKNSDKSYSSQMYFINGNKDEGTTLTGYYTWFEGENIVSIIAEKENEKVDFQYESIFDKKNIKPEDMCKGMKITIQTSFIDGKGTFKSNE